MIITTQLWKPTIWFDKANFGSAQWAPALQQLYNNQHVLQWPYNRC